MPATPQRAFLIPEVVQTSAMDCGPAALKALLEGFGVSASYGRLREACQTQVDGTSIDALEDLAVMLGLDAEQVMVPRDHVLAPGSEVLPAIAIVKQPTGLTHFLVLWRRHGPFVQVMDPAQGRRWVRAETIEGQLYVHEMPVPEDAFRDYAGSESFAGPLMRRLGALGASHSTQQEWLTASAADTTWETFARLDAVVRMVQSLVTSRAVSKGSEAVHLVSQFAEIAKTDPSIIPSEYWTAFAPDGPNVQLRGAVLVQVHGVDRAKTPADLPQELAAALAEPPARPGALLLQKLRQDGLLAPAFVAVALASSALGVLAEALVFRSAIEFSSLLRLPEQRLWTGAALGSLLVILAFLQHPVNATALRMGRQLEGRMRLAFLRKIPRLADRYFHSRLTSDMAQRAHSLHVMRVLPSLGQSLVSSVFTLLATCLGVIWLDPRNILSVLLVAALSVAVPLLLQPMLNERDMRVQTLFSTLTQYYLDSLLGLIPLRAHSAQLAMRREHEGHLVEWEHASMGLLGVMVKAEALTAGLGAILTVWLLWGYLAAGGAISGALLLVYWALRIPALGSSVARAARQYPQMRNVALRLMEPLSAPEVQAGTDAPEPGEGPVALSFERVSVLAGGQALLTDLDLEIEPGSRVGIVGASGAGKSTLVGLLLGWHEAAAGRILVDGEVLSPSRLETLRRETAWVDPAVQLWNRSLLHNLRYGNDTGVAPIAGTLDEAELLPLLETLPGGLSTPLGEGGALVSGGEGQRVRLARAMMRPSPRLTILDEPFRGLDRAARQRLLSAAMKRFQDSTLLLVTHDVSQTQKLDRVLVIDDGRLVQDGPPDELLAQTDSTYRRLMEADATLKDALWTEEGFRRVRVVGGAVEQGAP
ncbi:MAG: ATP-binding cassette domain-containing protein [Proteobacteria bacterium]|nr:ATP-binding cassette domain-containing protein [Pseudomonadota bacterium]